MKKRLLAMILAVVLAMSLLPMSALAVDGGNQGEQDPLKPASTTAESGKITLSKTATRTGPDTWDVDLGVKVGNIEIQQQPLEVVFVLDKSGSMAWCTTTEEHTHTIACYTGAVECTYESNDSHWWFDYLSWEWKHREDTRCTQMDGKWYSSLGNLTCGKETHEHKGGGVACDKVQNGSTDSTQWSRLKQSIAAINNAATALKAKLGNAVTIKYVAFSSDEYEYKHNSTKKVSNEVDTYTEDTWNNGAGITAKGATHLMAGVDAGIDQFSTSTSSRKVLIIVADGDSDSSPKYTSTKLTNFKAGTNKYVYCVGLTFSNADFWKMATGDGNDSTYYSTVSSGIDMTTFFQTITDSITGLIYDPMGSAVKVKDKNAVTVTLGGTADTDNLKVEDSLIQWTPTQGKVEANTTVAMDYQVTLKDLTVGTHSVPLNQNAVLQYALASKPNEAKTADFPVPYATYKVASLEVVYQDKNGNPLTLPAEKAAYNDGQVKYIITDYSDANYTPSFGYDAGYEYDALPYNDNETQQYNKIKSELYIGDAKVELADGQTIAGYLAANTQNADVAYKVVNTYELGNIPPVTAGYTVKYYYEAADGNYPADAGTAPKDAPMGGTAAIDSTVSVTAADAADASANLFAKSITVGDTRYVYDEVYSGNVLSTTIEANAANNVLKVYYALDADNTGVPDKYEVTVNYVTTGNGTVTPAKEVLTITDKDGKWAASGDVVAQGATASAASGYFFEKWMAQKNSDDAEKTNLTATTGSISLNNVSGGDIFTYTASFTKEAPGLTVEKEITSVLRDKVNVYPNTADEIAAFKAQVGDVITWTITVTNRGNIELTNIAVTDALQGVALETWNAPDGVTVTDNIISRLDKGASASVTATYTVTGEDAGKTIANTATAAAGATTGSETSSVDVKGYTVTYTDGVEGEEIFVDQVTDNLKLGDKTPDFSGTPSRQGYNFTGWTPARTETVTGNATYTAQWEKIAIGSFTKNVIKNSTEVAGISFTFPDNIKQESITFPGTTNGVVTIPSGGSVTLMYKLTVTGTVNANYTIEDSDVIVVSGSLSGTLGESKNADIYVIKTFTAADVTEKGTLLNQATITPGNNTAGPDDKTAESAVPTVQFAKAVVLAGDLSAPQVNGVTYPASTNTTITLKSGQTVILMYAITVTGAEGATYTVTDAGTTLEGTYAQGTVSKTADGIYQVVIPTDADEDNVGSVVIYVTKTFGYSDISGNKLTNIATITDARGKATETQVSTPAEKGSSGNTGGGGSVKPPVLNTEDHYGYIVGYPDGTVRPEGNITRAEVATIFFRMLTDASRAECWSQTNSYSDVSEGQWFNAAISTLSNAGIINGYSDGTFRPNGNITRAEFAAIASRFFEYAGADGENPFSDVSEDAWYYEYVMAASDMGLITGYPDGTFGPAKSITRAEAVTIVNRTLERAPDADHFLDDMITWPDNPESAWYYEAMQEATNSHEYQKKTASGSTYEVWTKILPVRDWVAYEKEWSDANSASGGEVVR